MLRTSGIAEIDRKVAKMSTFTHISPFFMSFYYMMEKVIM